MDYITQKFKRTVNPVHAMKAFRRSGGTAPLILKLGTRRK